MFVGVSRVELRVPASGSLKAKRHVIGSLVGGMRAKFNVAVAEVDHQQLWQRAAIAVTCVSGTPFHVRRMLHEVARWIERDDRVEVLSVTEHVLQPGDLA